MQNVALLGFGTVGASVARILDERISDVNLTSILVRAGKEHVDPVQRLILMRYCLILRLILLLSVWAVSHQLMSTLRQH